MDRPGMKGLRYVTSPKNSWSSVTLVGAGKACTTSTFTGSGWTPLASYRHPKKLMAWVLHVCLLWVEHQVVFAGNSHEIS